MTRAEAVAAAADVYRAILADPERAAQIRAHRNSEDTTDRWPAVGGPQASSNPSK